MSFATIDMNSGFVWWVGSADTPAEACARSHAAADHTAEFVECSSSNALYAVYEVPDGFAVDNGQDADAIKATQSHPFAGYFRCA